MAAFFACRRPPRNPGSLRPGAKRHGPKQKTTAKSHSKRIGLQPDMSMYVKAYLDLSVKSLVGCGCDSWPVHLGAWPGGSWLPWRAAPFLLCCCFVWFLRDFRRNGPVLRFTQTQEKKRLQEPESFFFCKRLSASMTRSLRYNC